MQTKSELVFEAFLDHHNLTWEKVPVDTSVPQSFRPDYLVRIDKHELVFETKELMEDEKFGVVSDPSHPHIKSFSSAIGEHVRRMIHGSRKQIQYGANKGTPSVLVIYNSVDRVFQDVGTSDLDFTTAMYGELTIGIDTTTGKASELFNGRNNALQNSKNTSFSAVGRLCDRGGKSVVTLFENVYAKVKLPFEQLPPCLEVKRVEISKEPLEFS